jgi:hypothetical protein
MQIGRRTALRGGADGKVWTLNLLQHRWHARRRFSRISALRIDLKECDAQQLAAILQAEAPGALLRRAWLPVPVQEQVWVLYEFPDVASRRAWESRISDRIRSWLDRDLIAPALRHGWPTRKETEAE